MTDNSSHMAENLSMIILSLSSDDQTSLKRIVRRMPCIAQKVFVSWNVPNSP